MTPLNVSAWNGTAPMVAPMPPGDVSEVGPGWTVWERVDQAIDRPSKGGMVWAVDTTADADGEVQRRFRVVSICAGSPTWSYVTESALDMPSSRKPDPHLVLDRIRSCWRYGLTRQANGWSRVEDDVLNTTWRLAEVVVKSR